ncbi:serine hydrolase domain-containing protein [Phenylobacterium sp.]|uniref:serine hydrolase domain-containing protein n=1 Tax=Phenylobacterium sp. TaxID=1871053 RepID=UPI002D1CF4FC|nr:serine hydrolase domain-containing protein [Phenylobacterium sp.]HLZ74694.1 serine hydrolase domain-containing protein [Phenylobacterium sp.]
MKLAIAAFTALLMLTSAARAAGPSPADQAAITAIETRVGRTATAGETQTYKTLAERMAELKVPGLSVAVFEHGHVVWAKAYGAATAGGPSATPDTLFQAASMSKALAATAALKLVEQGRLDLDEDVNTRLKAWKVPPSPYTAQSKVTLRRLLSHTAGMTVSGFPGYAAGVPIPTLLQILNGTPPSNTPAIQSYEAPGGLYAYSGGGFTVAQLMIVEAGGKPYPDLLKTLVLGPAGMKQSTFAQPLPPALIPHAASGHNRKGEVIPGGRNVYPEYAAAGLWTTPSDYGRFMIALQDAYAGRPHAILTQASARAMMTPVDAAAGYGFGEGLGRRGGHPYFSHSGGNEGFQCNSLAFLDGAGQGVVVMTNSDSGGIVAGEIFRALGEAYHWGDPDPANGKSSRRAPDRPPAAQ